MTSRRKQFVLVLVFLLLVFTSMVGVIARPAFRQKASEVVVREPGKRFLGPPRAVMTEARDHFEFALLSQAAYQRLSVSRNGDPVACQNADSALHNLGWSRWTDFPDKQLSDKIAKSHLRVEVWTNPLHDGIAVAFGGTEASSGKDWKSNLRWFIPHHHDEYTDLVEEFGPAFVREFQKRSEQSQWAYLRSSKIFSTGHSLGGGLAQEFAYSLPKDIGVRRVKRVFAFDPSPVTGYYSVNSTLRDANTEELVIDRIYERGEILAILRSIVNLFYPPSAIHPTIREVRYHLLPRSDPIGEHSISDFACRLQEVTH